MSWRATSNSGVAEYHMSIKHFFLIAALGAVGCIDSSSSPAEGYATDESEPSVVERVPSLATHRYSIDDAAFQPAPAILARQGSYRLGEELSLSFKHLPGNALDWIAIAPKDSDDITFVSWVYTNGQTDGAVSFSELPPGVYVARAFENDGWTKLAESAPLFVTTAAKVKTDKSTYAAGEAITVSYSNFSGAQTDWITIVAADTMNESYNEFYYTAGNTMGEMSFSGLDRGTYEVRGFYNDQWTRIATSSFTVE
jgi:hypothetical protein